MWYKTELHAHTKEVSRCSHIEAKRMVEVYKENGYRTLVTVDHFSPDTFNNWATDDWNKTVDYFMRGNDEAKAFEDENFSVLFGFELRFSENYNDYLVFGADKEFLLNTPRVIGYGIEKFIKIARDAGLVTVQAHPFRNGMTITNPDFVDGVEIHNMHPNQLSRNEIAELWAKKFPQLIQTGGTDYHQFGFPLVGGIKTEMPITTNSQLVELLKNREYKVL